MQKMDIGFVEKCESWELESRFFASKVGGKPAWLDLKRLPDIDQVACEYCKHPCIFLCQIYAPYKEERAFHRTLFIFICKNAHCCKANENGNLKIFRSQLERVNEFYSPDPPEDDKNWRKDIQIKNWSKTCCVCGILSRNYCSKCKKTSYCSRVHQILDWRSGHKKVCGTDKEINAKDILFPEFKLVIVNEEDEDDDDDDDVEEENEEDNDDEVEENTINSKLNLQSNNLPKNSREIDKFTQLVKNNIAGTLNHIDNVDLDLINFANKEEDETFNKFQYRVKKYPDQVIRYERGGYPLYISSFHQAEIIPKCEECNSERQFEFQIMPQLLNHLSFEETFNSLDWGIIAVFTCKRSCVPKTGYASEWILKQDITKNENNSVNIN